MLKYYDPRNDNANAITAGPPASQLPADYLESHRAELEGLVTRRGLTLDGGDNTQIEQAFRVPYAATVASDAYQIATPARISDGHVITVDIPGENTSAAPTLENTAGGPSGAAPIVTTQGVAFANMLEARPHRFQWQADAGHWLLLDPAGGVVERGVNSNGKYVRWGNGEQQVFGTFDFVYSGAPYLASQFNHAATFVEIYAITMAGLPTSSSAYSDLGKIINYGHAVLASGNNLLLRASYAAGDWTSGDYIRGVAYVGHGRWK